MLFPPYSAAFKISELAVFFFPYLVLLLLPGHWRAWPGNALQSRYSELTFVLSYFLHALLVTSFANVQSGISSVGDALLVACELAALVCPARFLVILFTGLAVWLRRTPSAVLLESGPLQSAIVGVAVMAHLIYVINALLVVFAI